MSRRLNRRGRWWLPVIRPESRGAGARPATSQARLALEHGRPVFLPEPLLEERWAREFADRPGTHVVREPEEIIATIERLNSPGALVP